VTTAKVTSDVVTGTVDDPMAHVVFEHMVGGNILAPGDAFTTTRPVPRDVLDPPLRDNEWVLFDDADDGPRDISRSNCGR
jgi:hypothetical protein